MKLTVKTLKNDKFQVDIDDAATVIVVPRASPEMGNAFGILSLPSPTMCSKLTARPRPGQAG